MGEPHWVTLGERVVHDGWVRVLERDYRLPDGRTTTWQLRAAGDSVGVLPLTPTGEVVLVREFRPGPDRHMVTIPGGLVDTGESAQQAAVARGAATSGTSSSTSSRTARCCWSLRRRCCGCSVPGR